jgi:hypothetical protein
MKSKSDHGLGTRHTRKLKRYSDNFNRSFLFFVQLYRKDIVRFCGKKVEVFRNEQADEARFVFREYDDGKYKPSLQRKMETRQPNLLNAAIVGKAGWGLWVDQWSDGIVEGSFTIREILDIFKERGVVVPESFLTEFYNVIHRKMMKRVLREDGQ